MINYYGLVELINLWENKDEEGRALVDDIMNNLFPGTREYYIYGRRHTFTDFSSVWAIHYLLAMVKNGMIEVPKEKLMHRTHENPDGLIWEDDFVLIPGCGEVFIPMDARIIQ